MQKYITQINNRGDDFVSFEFSQLEGEKDFGLLKTVFEEFIRYPILRSLEIGLPLVRIARVPILNNVIDVSVVEHEETDIIEFQLRGSLLKNKILPRDEVDLNDDRNFYLQMNAGGYLVLESVTASNVGTVLSIMYLIDWLDGMPVEVNYEDYVPKCANCVFDKECISKYIYLLDALSTAFVNDRDGCILGEKSYEKGEICGRYYVRDTYPDLGEVRAVISDFR